MTTMNTEQQKILEAAKRYSAYADSILCIRGEEDILEFADEVQGMAIESVETCGTRPEPPFTLEINPAKIHEVFEHDQQCDDMAGVPNIPA
jgi:hypothetical protein